MKYFVSTYGDGVAIGIEGDPLDALHTAQLAENIYGYSHDDSLFSRLIRMPSIRQFKKFLILKEYLFLWSEYLKSTGDKLQTKERVILFTRQAIKKAKETMNNNVVYENFMLRNRGFVYEENY